jgi:hypothetical protein
MQPRSRFGVSRAELEDPVPGWLPDGADQSIDYAELVTHSAQGVSWTEEVIRPHQRVPLIVKQVDQLLELPGGKRLQAGTRHRPAPLAERPAGLPIISAGRMTEAETE